MLRAFFGQDGGVPARQGQGRGDQGQHQQQSQKASERGVGFFIMGPPLYKTEPTYAGIFVQLYHLREGRTMERPDKNIETADILRSAVRDGGRRGAAAWVGAALPPARGRRTAPLSAFFGLGCYPYRNAM